MNEPKKLTAEQYREMARGQYKKADESWERSDTDGFLSQWAGKVMGARYHALADLAEAGWVDDFPALFEIESGRRVDAKKIRGRFGPCWLLADDEAAHFGKKFIPLDSSHDEDRDPGQASRSQVQRDLGLIQKWEQAPAFVAMSKGDTPFPFRFRTDGR